MLMALTTGYTCQDTGGRADFMQMYRTVMESGDVLHAISFLVNVFP